MKRNIILYFFPVFLLSLSIGCTDLEENVIDEQLGADLINNPNNIESLINPPYGSLRNIIEWYDYWGLQQVTSDETIFPTRGSDWFDNGAWQQLHLHSWTPDHIRFKNVWDNLSRGVSRSNTAIYYIGQFEQNATTEQYINEARFLRAYFSYHMLDLWGKFPWREAEELDFSITPEVKVGKEAVDFLIDEINAVLPKLKTRSEVGSERVTQGAAHALLTRIYLNYEVYAGEPKWSDAITHADALINSGNYTVTDDYWSMFQWDVTGAHPEFILTVPMSDAVDMGGGSVWINFTLHYNQVFGTYTSFWNGGTTTSTFLNTWDRENDVRFYDDRIRPETGINQGFLVGQQFDVEGNPVLDRNDNNLVFVPEVILDDSPENYGIRVVKFAPNPQTERQFSSPNDVPLFRISDIYLMRGEAKFRSGDVNGALEDINYIRARRSAGDETLPQLTTLTLDDILLERGYELYWEGFRRQDLIRFGKFTQAWQEKPVTDATKNLFPLPTSALDVNENLEQNPGY